MNVEVGDEILPELIRITSGTADIYTDYAAIPVKMTNYSRVTGNSVGPANDKEAVVECRESIERPSKICSV